MKKLFLTILVLSLLVALGSPSRAESKLMLGIGADVLLPMGDFKDAVSTGFGGSARVQYEVAPMFCVGGTVGYYTWSGKDLGGNLGTGPKFSGVPVRAFGKYYFMPAGKPRVYGIAELGVFFGSSGDVTYPGYTIPGIGTIGGGTIKGESSTSFNYAPGIGIELPLGAGKTLLDISARWDAISKSGSTANNIAARVAVNFGLGN